MRAQWSEEQRHRIAENEAVLRQLAEIEPKADSLSIKTHLPRGNNLTVEEQIAIIHGGATPAQYEAAREMLLERQRQDIIDNTSPISPVFEAPLTDTQAREFLQPNAKPTSSVEWDDFPELDAKYDSRITAQNSTTDDSKAKPPVKSLEENLYNSSGSKDFRPNATHHSHTPRQNTSFLNTNSLLCTGPCPIQAPHDKGAYLQQGQIPRVWNARWGYSDPPREIWEAWVRIEQGRARYWDQVEVDAFALSHWWGGE